MSILVYYEWISKAPSAPLPEWLGDLLAKQMQNNTTAKQSARSADDLARVREALRFVPAADRNKWRDVGFALKSQFGESGWTVFDEWSRTAPEHYNDAENLKQWRTFQPDGGITIGTVFHYAKQNGGQSDRRRYKPGSVTAEYLSGGAAEDNPLIEPPPKYSPPPLTLFPARLRDYVRAESETLAVDVAFVFLPLLSALSAAIGNSRNLCVKRGFAQPAILWTAIVARSGSKKSPALSASTTSFCERERELLRLNGAAEAVFEKQHREWDASPKKERGDEPKPPPRFSNGCSRLKRRNARMVLRPRNSLLRPTVWKCSNTFTTASVVAPLRQTKKRKLPGTS